MMARAAQHLHVSGFADHQQRQRTQRQCLPLRRGARKGAFALRSAGRAACEIESSMANIRKFASIDDAAVTQERRDHAGERQHAQRCRRRSAGSQRHATRHAQRPGKIHNRVRARKAMRTGDRR